MQKSTFILTNHELEFISDPDTMRLKQKLIRNICEAMDTLGDALKRQYYADHPGRHKVTRGENYLDMPYVVLDVPQLGANNLDGKLRIMWWWGHYISLQYFVLTENLMQKIRLLKHPAYHVLTSGDLFNNNLEHENFQGVNEVQHITLPLTKICTKVSFAEAGRLHERSDEFMSAIVKAGLGAAKI